MDSSRGTWVWRFHVGFLGAAGVDAAEGGSATAVAAGGGGCWVVVASHRKHDLLLKGAATA